MSTLPPLTPAVPTADNASVTVVVTRVVKPGRETEFEKWVEGVSAAAKKYEGNVGVDVFRPEPGDREWVVIYRFDKYANLKRWSVSKERMEWVAKADALSEGGGHLQVVTGMEHWFSLPRRHAPDAPSPPPRWKMALLTWLVIFPLVNILNAVVLPLTGALPNVARVAISTVILVPLMTWVVMPGVTRLFVRWLFPAAR